MMKQLLFCFSLLLLSVTAIAQDSFTCRAQRYIAKYSCYAVAEQRRSGVPASITLAQGVLETEAGNSELVAKGNNHFGIKCKNGYCGPKMYHDDDRPNEAFIVYDCAEASYKDHSDYLKRNKRYEPLFNYPPTDYKSWAKGLKKCGYATNPIYADRLIKIIEDFGLQDYTMKALSLDTSALAIAATSAPVTPEKKDTIKKITVVQASKQPGNKVVLAPPPTVFAGALAIDTPSKKTVQSIDSVKPTTTANVDTQKTEEQIAQTLTSADLKFDSGKVIVRNGLKAFYANKGEMLLQYAVKYNIRYPRLLEINELPDAPLSANTLIYLEKKHNEGTHAKHTVKEGENMYMIAQEEGMILKHLMALNMLDPNDEPAIGTILELQNGAARKPALRATPPPDLKNSHNLSFVPPTPADGYVAVTHPKPGDTAAKHPVRTVVNRDTYVTTIHTAADSTVKVETQPVKHIDSAIAKNTQPKAVLDSTDEDSTKDELATLKAKLDKVVYPKDRPEIKYEEPKKNVPIVLSPIDDEPAPKVKKETRQKATGNTTVYYTVKKGDNLSKIAKSQHTTIDEILRLNDIDEDNLHLGQKLKISGAPASEPVEKPKKIAAKEPKEKATPKGAAYYTVKKGDNLSNIAKSQHTTIDAILSANDIDEDNLHLGQKLKIPHTGDNGPDEKPKKGDKEPKEKATQKGSNYYTVKNGDNLSNIAKRQHITVKELIKLNKDIDADDLHLGQKLRVK